MQRIKTRWVTGEVIFAGMVEAGLSEEVISPGYLSGAGPER